MLYRTEEQKLAIEKSEGPVVVLASAGSGKTTVLVDRYLRHLEEGITPNEILAVTFTTDAADQMRRRLFARLRGEEPDCPPMASQVRETRSIGTIHSLCFRLLLEFGKEPIQEIATDLRSATLCEQAYGEWTRNISEEDLQTLLRIWPLSVLREMLQLLGSRRNLWNECPKTGVTETLEKLTAPYLAAVTRLHREKAIWTFEDLEFGALRLLEERRIREMARARYRAFLIDEFQDTSPIQWKIIQHLFAEDRSRVFLVGDPRQSIYSFRDADVSLFSEQAHTASERDALIPLSVNFRSAPRLIEDINRVTRTLFAESTLAPMKPSDEAVDCDEDGIKSFSFDEGQEIASVVSSVTTEIGNGTSPDEIALLFRTSDRIPTFASALESRGIRTHSKRRVNLFELREVWDIANFLRALVCPADGVALAAFLRSPYVNWNGRSLDFESLLTESPPELRWFLGLLDQGETDLQSVLRALFLNSDVSPSAPVLEFLTHLCAQCKSVFEAVDQIALWSRHDVSVVLEPDATSNGVRLLTVHASKGLEFEHVMLVDLSRSGSRRAGPLKMRWNQAAGVRYFDREENEWKTTPEYDLLAKQEKEVEEAESKRLLYVALTRAKRRITCFLPKDSNRKGWAQLLS